MEDEISSATCAFLDALTELGGQLSEIYKTGNVQVLTKMNATVLRMHDIQSGSGESALAAVDEECKVIYANFDMLVAVLKTTEEGIIDIGAQKALNKFLHNINGAVVNIASMFGLL